MEDVMTFLTDKQETFVWTIVITGMPTDGARLTCIVGIHLDCQASRQLGFIGTHALKFGKRPLGIRGVRLPLLFARLFAFVPFGSLSDVCQMLQSDQTVRVLSNDAFGDTMIGVLLQPSLSSANHHQTAGSCSSAFLLQTLPQSRIMVGSGNDLFSRLERMLTTCVAGHSQIADTHIYASTTSLVLWIRVGSLDFKGN